MKIKQTEFPKDQLYLHPFLTLTIAETESETNSFLKLNLNSIQSWNSTLTLTIPETLPTTLSVPGTQS